MKSTRLTLFIFLFICVGLIKLQALDPIDLGTAKLFTVLSKAGISTTTGTSVTGNMGVSPIASTAITGFALTMDGTNVFSTSAMVTGKVYASNYAAPTPSNLSTAIGNMETAYNNAAGATPDFIELHAGDLSGQTLAPGVYKWSTGVIINDDVYLNGGADDVWIFQIAGTLVQASNKDVVLQGAAHAENIFWQVAGNVTVGTGAHFAGTILGFTNIVLQTGASIDGRTLAQTAVTLDGNTVNIPITVPDLGPVVNVTQVLTYDLIQDAVDEANAGDEITASAITYTENVVIPAGLDGLTITGFDKETTFIDGDGSGTVVTIRSNDVVIEGFTVHNSGGGDAGISIEGASGVIIDDNIITDNSIGIAIVDRDGFNSSGNTISDNTIEDNIDRGISINHFFINTSTNTLNVITNNVISGTSAEGSGVGIYLGETASLNEITNNEIFDNTQYGIELYLSDDNEFSNNVIYDNADGAIYIGGGQNNTFDYETITGSVNQTHGLITAIADATDAAGNEIHNSSITGHTVFGVEAEDAANEVDATCNWWGDVNGPDHTSNLLTTTGNAVSDNVIFNPWFDGPIEEGGECLLSLDNIVISNPVVFDAVCSDVPVLFDKTIGELGLSILGSNEAFIPANYTYSYEPSFLVDQPDPNSPSATLTRVIRDAEYYLVVTEKSTGRSGRTLAYTVTAVPSFALVNPGLIVHRFHAEDVTAPLNLYKLSVGEHYQENGKYQVLGDPNGPLYTISHEARIGWAPPEGFDPRNYIPQPNDRVYLWIILTQDESPYCEIERRRFNLVVRGNEIVIQGE